MRTKLFLAFIFIIFLALLSNVFFERLIIRDFDDFLKGNNEDHIYWILASIEGSYSDKQWDMTLLSEALHWGLMLGFETSVQDTSGRTILSSTEVLSSLSPHMLTRMNSLFQIPSGWGDLTWYPLFIEGEEIGKLNIRPLQRLGLIPVKEEIFRRRGREFLITSFLIAGGGALLLALLFTAFLSSPLRKLTIAAEKIARGDFEVQGPKRKKIRIMRASGEIDKLTDTFNYMAEALRREDELRKHLTSNIAHELRTPLTIIRGNLEAIEDGILSDPHEVIKNIKSEIQRIISLVEGVENITRAEASFFQRGTPEVIDLREFVESLISSMRKLIEGKGLFLKTEGLSIQVRTYPDKLHIILKNLLTNACKYTQRGGITIHWDRCRENDAPGFCISVKDTGKGMDEREKQKIFSRFYKGAESKGTGLGLSIVRELTDVMSGEIKVKSSPGNGSIFTLFFPT